MFGQLAETNTQTFHTHCDCIVTGVKDWCCWRHIHRLKVKSCWIVCQNSWTLWKRRRAIHRFQCSIYHSKKIGAKRKNFAFRYTVRSREIKHWIKHVIIPMQRRRMAWRNWITIAIKFIVNKITMKIMCLAMNLKHLTMPYIQLPIQMQTHPTKTCTCPRPNQIPMHFFYYNHWVNTHTRPTKRTFDSRTWEGFKNKIKKYIWCAVIRCRDSANCEIDT